ncbi:hypothetical protein AB0B94_32510 [Micromonospora sp. NPDC048986]|uniref:hypothetical protein n=1 Tax=Micromonospora sp. NPDC048986 TaxID=3155644 RepID=UPI0033EDCBA6
MVRNLLERRKLKSRGVFRRATVVGAASIGLLLAFAGPAQAGSSSVSHQGGGDAYVTYTFNGTRSVSLTVRVVDWKCNSHSAWGGVEVIGGGLDTTTLDFWNGYGCNTEKTMTQTYTSSTNIINIRVGADGDGRPGGLATVFGTYQDNPYT